MYLSIYAIVKKLSELNRLVCKRIENTSRPPFACRLNAYILLDIIARAADIW